MKRELKIIAQEEAYELKVLGVHFEI